MKQLSFTLLMLFFLVACKEDSPKPEPAIQGIVGTWKHIAYERVVDGEKKWVPVDGEPYYMTFRSDGLILNAAGLPACCAPNAYYVNGELFQVTPKTTPPVNPQCALVDCVGCETWNIEQTANELIVTLCEPVATRSKYVRN